MQRARSWLRAFAGALSAVLVVGVLASCSSKPFTERTGALVWHECGAVLCSSMSVPLDHAHPDGAEIQLALARRPADGKRIGVLLTNPGGPGGSGIDLVRNADGVFGPSVREHFDIVSWDPRGVGQSTRVVCTDDLDEFYAVDCSDAEASTARENVEVTKEFVAACRRHSGTLLPHMSTSDSVDDMDAIRGALGAAKVSYLGFSYGTYLGAMYADRYPDRVRGMVLDGAIDPAQSFVNGTIRQAAGFDRALDAFLEWCAKNDSKCHFARHGNPTTAFHDLTQSLSHETLPAEVNDEERTLGPGEANIGIATALYGGKSANGGWEDLGKALRDAAQGNGSALLALSDRYTGRGPNGHYDGETDAFYAIGCLDAPAPPTIAAVRKAAARAEKAAPVFGASNVWLGLPCTFWPAPAVGKVGAIHAPGAPPILVIGTTDDPATPYASAQALARELKSGHLLTYVGEGHTAYGPEHACVDDKVDAYLVSGQLPPEGTRCK